MRGSSRWVAVSFHQPDQEPLAPSVGLNRFSDEGLGEDCFFGSEVEEVSGLDRRAVRNPEMTGESSPGAKGVSFSDIELDR